MLFVIASCAILAGSLVGAKKKRRARESSGLSVTRRRSLRFAKPTRRQVMFVVAGTLAIVAAIVLLGLFTPRAAEEAAPMDSHEKNHTAEQAQRAAEPDETSAAVERPNHGLPKELAVGGAFLITLAMAGLALTSSRSKPTPAEPAVCVADVSMASLLRSAELGLAQVTRFDQDPGPAIIRCYLAMEQELTYTPDVAPTAHDTASEVLARAIGKGVLSPASAKPLVMLFAEARFSTHQMTERHRDEAIGLLQRVLAELGAGQ